MSDFSDDDESSIKQDIKTEFNKAANYIQLNHTKFNQNDLLEFYALYKQSTCGKCNTSKPSIFNIQARSKWDAWNNLGELDNFKAMELYIKKLQTLESNWNQQNINENKKDKIQQWVCTSIPVKDIEDEIPEIQKTPFDYIRENNLNKIQKIINKDNVNEIKDENGMHLIHWAVDRNTPEILEYFISLNANINLQDSELQTPLHYATTCGHLKCIQILINHGADKNILDGDGLTCIDVAYDDTIKNFLMMN